jgi:hypothetical protein
MFERLPGIEYEISTRWARGVPHDPRSIALFRRISELDFEVNDDLFIWKSGGDGDNGEDLMYILDIIFEEDDARKGKNKE